MIKNKDMIYGGFDPTFIDINILPFNEDNSSLIANFPPLGSHHSQTSINLIPGGNGFNLCRTLSNFGRSVTFVGPSSPLYENLVKEQKIALKIKPIKNAEVNFTGIINLQEGEIQFNSVKSYLSTEHLSADIIDCYRKSPLKSVSNIALNPTSIEWNSSLVLSLWTSDVLEYIHKQTDPLSILKDQKTTYFDGILFIDPSDISHFKKLLELQIFLSELKKLEGDKFLSLNERELKCLTGQFQKNPQELYEFLHIPIIFHSADEVIFYGKNQIKLKTKHLTKKTTFVGAGDCFNGAFIHSFFNNNSVEDSLLFAIESASYLIETGNYPS